MPLTIGWDRGVGDNIYHKLLGCHCPDRTAYWSLKNRECQKIPDRPSTLALSAGVKLSASVEPYSGQQEEETMEQFFEHLAYNEKKWEMKEERMSGLGLKERRLA
jgi:hypothetical protein